MLFFLIYRSRAFPLASKCSSHATLLSWGQLPEQRFRYTMSMSIIQAFQSWVANVGRMNTPILSYLCLCRKEDKLAALIWLLREVVREEEPTIVFTSTRHHVEFLFTVLQAAGVSAACVYGAMDQVRTSSLLPPQVLSGPIWMFCGV